MNQIASLKRNETGIETAVSILSQSFGPRCQTGQSIREQHGHTTTWIPNQPPDAVVFAESTEEVANIVRIASDHQVPVIAFGTGTSLEGHVNAPAGGICIDLSSMSNVVQVFPEDLSVTIQAGLTRKALNEHLRDTGLFFPIDPGADASLGGMAATRASGTNAVRYGTMKDNVLSLEAVLPNGQVIRTGNRAKKSSAGYDLTRLLIGSEGTLGIITELTLKLYGIPEAMAAARCAFPTVEAACNAVILSIQSGLPIARMELLDTESVLAINAYSKLDLPASPILLLEFHGTEGSVAEQSELFGEIAEEFNGHGFTWTTKSEDRNKLWQARHDAYWALLKIRPGAEALATDVCVPISRLAEAVSRTEAHAKDLGLVAPIVGHVGDGNFHATLLVSGEEERKKAEEFLIWLSALAIELDGTITGEHGIGQGKVGSLVKEMGAATDVMQSIKRALDPLNIMNPGKIFAP